MSADCHGNVLLRKDERQIINCEKCGYIHVFPLYSEEELENFYENLYAESTPSYLWYEKVHNIRKWKKTGTILDIGCWEGKQLEFFMKDGWQCVGIELNKKAAAIATSKGIEVHQISIRQFFDSFAERKWDVINAAYILEHIPDPAGFLVRLKNNLETKGIIIADTKFEFGFYKDGIILIDELLTPDSSRFWPKDSYKLGGAQLSYDKQFVRDYLVLIKWNKEPPAPRLPEEVVLKTREKYMEAYRRLTDKKEI